MNFIGSVGGWEMYKMVDLVVSYSIILTLAILFAQVPPVSLDDVRGASSLATSIYRKVRENIKITKKGIIINSDFFENATEISRNVFIVRVREKLGRTLYFYLHSAGNIFLIIVKMKK